MDHTFLSQSTDSTLTLIGLLLAALALTLGWFLYRLERLADRRRDIDAASGVLRGVRRGMVEVVDGDAGWGAHYFTTVYTTAEDDPEVMPRVQAVIGTIQKGSFTEVWPVPTAPLEEVIAAAAHGEGLISEETIFTANVGLWRIGVFNHLVRMQSDFNVHHLAEIQDTELPDPRRTLLATVAGNLSKMLHQHGIGEANVAGGWYKRFSEALAADIERLATLRRRGMFEYSSRAWLLVGDVVFALLPIGFVALVVIDTV